MSWQTSPAATEVEEVMMDWLRQMVGLSEAWTGVIHDTASTATLSALICARERLSDFAPVGLQAPGGALTVYTSVDGHSSVEKAVRLAGLGKAHLRGIPTDGACAMRPDALRDSMRGGRPFRALKLWFQVLAQGVAGIRDRIRRDLANAQWLAGQVAAAPG